jgi:dipeptidyl aminopeptidase/acylaminoacyl peptidase
MSRPPTPQDLVRLVVPTEPRLSPDGLRVAFTVQTTAPALDGYRHAIWLAAVDASAKAAGPRQITIGAKHDHAPRFSPDGRTLAFLSDRRLAVEEDLSRPNPSGNGKGPTDREDAMQVYLLPLDGGEARRLTDLPRGVEDFEWSPDGTHLLVTTTSHAASREEDARRRGKDAQRKPGAPPESDYRYIDRLTYMYNGRGFIYDRIAHLWTVDATTGEARRITEGASSIENATWSPDGKRIAFVSNRRADRDLFERRDITVVDVATSKATPVTSGPNSNFFAIAWLPDGKSIAALGGRIPANSYRNDIWLFAANGSDASADGGRNLSGAHDLMPGSGMNSDVTPGEPPRLVPSHDGAWITFTAPVDGSYELWGIATSDGRVERLTKGRHYISSFDQIATDDGDRIAFIRSSAVETPDVFVLDIPSSAASMKPRASRRLTSLNDTVLKEIELRAPVERKYSVDGREIQGWLLPAGAGKQPLVTEIHGGPHTLYGWSLVWEFQVLAGSGISVFYSNPRGSEGYGREFNEANLGDWGPGPMRDVLAGIDSLGADGLADPERLGLTGGSYGGYLTNWILAHDKRFRAAITCRSVSDMTMLFLTGDISGGEWAELEFGATPWKDPQLYRDISPITYAHQITTPLLIQHSENDLRTTIGQGEALFTVLRSHKRPVRFMRVPEETHELTRSGTPFRRVENLVQVRDWFKHFLIEGKRGLPPLPKARAGK